MIQSTRFVLPLCFFLSISLVTIVDAQPNNSTVATNNITGSAEPSSANTAAIKGGQTSTKKPERDESDSVTISVLSQREKGIIIISVILAVFILCLIICALCICCTSKVDRNDETLAEPLPQTPVEPRPPESGWTTIRSESGNLSTTRH